MSGESKTSSADVARRRQMIIAASEGANPEYIEGALRTAELGGPDTAVVEFTVLFSWVNRLIQQAHDHSWLKERLGAIEYRGGPRNKVDEAYLRLNLSEEQVTALTEIIREKQLEVAHGFFGIHSGAYSFTFEPIPELRFTIHYGRNDPDSNVVDQGALPNGIDISFMRYTDIAGS